MFVVKDLQACEPESLPLTPDADGCYVVLSCELDSMGFKRADVLGPSKGVLWQFILDNWGDNGFEWAHRIVESTEEVLVPLKRVVTVEAISEELSEACDAAERALGMLREMLDRAWEDRRHDDYNELTASLALIEHAQTMLQNEMT